ncbi:hypothetical protein FGO68_gene9415 [Halteria grandinella]|uniref:Uncharacterized protein n=1 Tax=Halteria grandinella TaxID=5974 RepID=A0A8J8NLZ4_HALGN|nr:hypothetical protein FGO68_gene9415 [Halteria grandinella]
MQQQANLTRNHTFTKLPPTQQQEEDSKKPFSKARTYSEAQQGWQKVVPPPHTQVLTQQPTANPQPLQRRASVRVPLPFGIQSPQEAIKQSEIVRLKRRSMFTSPFCLTKKLQHLQEIKRGQELICSQPLATNSEEVLPQKEQPVVLSQQCQQPSKRRRLNPTAKHDSYIEYLVESSEVLKESSDGSRPSVDRSMISQETPKFGVQSEEMGEQEMLEVLKINEEVLQEMVQPPVLSELLPCDEASPTMQAFPEVPPQPQELPPELEHWAQEEEGAPNLSIPDSFDSSHDSQHPLAPDRFSLPHSVAIEDQLHVLRKSQLLISQQIQLIEASRKQSLLPCESDSSGSQCEGDLRKMSAREFQEGLERIRQGMPVVPHMILTKEIAAQALRQRFPMFLMTKH